MLSGCRRQQTAENLRKSYRPFQILQGKRHAVHVEEPESVQSAAVGHCHANAVMAVSLRPVATVIHLVCRHVRGAKEVAWMQRMVQHADIVAEQEKLSANSVAVRMESRVLFVMARG